MVEEFKKSYKNGYEVMLKPEERDQLVEYINELEQANNIINELAFIFDDYNEFNKILEKYSYELKGSDKE